MHFLLAFLLIGGLALGVGIANDNVTQLGTVSTCVPANLTAYDNITCAAAEVGQGGLAEGEFSALIQGDGNRPDIGLAIPDGAPFAQPEHRRLTWDVPLNADELIGPTFTTALRTTRNAPAPSTFRMKRSGSIPPDVPGLAGEDTAGRASRGTVGPPSGVVAGLPFADDINTSPARDNGPARS